MLLEDDILNDVGSQDLRSALLGAARPIRLAASETVFSEDDQGDALYVVLSGRVEISIACEDGRRLGLDVLSRGAVFGEIALFDPGPRTATAVALEQCQLLMLRHGDLKRAIAGSPGLAFDLLRLMGQRMRYMNLQLHEYVFMPLPQRLARKVLQFASRDGEGRARLMLSHSELAELAGASREAVSKVLSGWKKQGTLQTGRGFVEVKNEVTLRKIAGI
ncbi:Crp/Fnr family transcriptional regulator [Tateyamaria sp. Alg231-49]|uniref:Crp/Fnr family transcriptional regulator n=1 Tax=Tateyamaria sp. Alg231-49 TaxID=1922219 RepID=UPI000D54FDC4|nr:Crp/Fnr family transcriptional regulator [Tateyamaria sp. Alg231-49]